jgi:hypothetical protein
MLRVDVRIRGGSSPAAAALSIAPILKRRTFVARRFSRYRLSIASIWS